MYKSFIKAGGESACRSSVSKAGQVEYVANSVTLHIAWSGATAVAFKRFICSGLR